MGQSGMPRLWREEWEWTHKSKDLLPLVNVGEANAETFGHAAENGRVDVVWPVRRAEHHDPVRARREPVPQPVRRQPSPSARRAQEEEKETGLTS